MYRLEELKALYTSHRNQLAHYYIDPDVEISADTMMGELFQEIEQLQKDNERFIKSNIEVAHMNANYLIEIERLRKEKEWLISRYVEDSYTYIYYPHMEMEEIRSSVEAEMQQVLKKEGK